MMELLSSTAKLCIFNIFIGLFSDPQLWSWILDTERNSAISSASGRDGIFAKCLRCDTSR